MEPPDSERWQPAWQEQYWYLDFVGGISTGTWSGEDLDLQRWEVGNCFESSAQAAHASEHIHELWLNLHKPC